MKKSFLILRYFLLVLVILAAGGLGYLFIKGASLDRESKAFVDQVIPAIANGWDKPQFVRNMSPDFLKKYPEEKIGQVLASFHGLGKFLRYEGAVGESKIIMTQNGMDISAHYSAKLAFDSGPAEVRITLVQIDHQWKIDGFRVVSDVFKKQ